MSFLNEKINKKTVQWIVLVLLLFIAIASVLFNVFYDGTLPTLFITQQDIESELFYLKKDMRRLKKTKEMHEKSRRLKESFLKRSKEFWIESRDGVPENVITQFLETAASDARVLLSSQSTLRHVKKGKKREFDFMSMRVSATGDYLPLMKFLEALHNSRPQIHWSNCSIRFSHNKFYFTGSFHYVLLDDKRIKALLLGIPYVPDVKKKKGE